MKLKYYFLLLPFILPLQPRAQDTLEYRLNSGPNGFAYSHCLEEVYFSGTANSNYIAVTKDDGSGEYQAPQFTQNCNSTTGGTITRQAPVAYVSGTKAMVKAIFKTDCPHSFLIRGLGPLVGPVMLNMRYVFPEQMVSPMGGKVTYDFENAQTSFPSLNVNYWKNFTITWQMAETPPPMTPPNQIQWEDIDESSNPLYVTYKQPDPIQVSSGYEWFHTLLKTSCEAAKFKSNDNDIINSIWAKLQTRHIKAADSDKSLFYYKNWGTCTAYTTADLLKAEDGQCGSWARFFIDLLKTQGIDHSTITDDFFHFGPTPGTADGFFVNNWRLQLGLLNSFDPIFKYTCIPKQNPSLNWQLVFEAGNKYNFHYTDFVDESGLDGQGPNSTPESIFGNHQITNINGNLFDPSYGEKFLSLQDVENRALFGYLVIDSYMMDERLYDFDANGFPDDLNGNGIIEANADVLLILVTTDKNQASLSRTNGAPTNH